MDRRAKFGWALVLVGILAGGAMLWMNPLPADHEQWMCCEGAAGVLMVARGPALARYDAATDTTVALFRCAHGYCRVATQIAGDATEEVARAQTILYSPTGVPARGEVDLAEPIELPAEGMEGRGNVTQVTAARFEVGDAWLPLLLYQLAFLAVVVGWWLVAVGSDASVLGGALGAGLGVFFGARMAAEGAFAALIWPALLLVFAVGLGSAALVGAKRWPRGAAGGALLLSFAAALVFSMLVATRYFVHPPTL